MIWKLIYLGAVINNNKKNPRKLQGFIVDQKYLEGGEENDVVEGPLWYEDGDFVEMEILISVAWPIFVLERTNKRKWYIFFF